MSELKVKVNNLRSPRTGNEIPNQFKIRIGNDTYFQSYDSIIVKQTPEKTYLDNYYWNYSRMTSKYRGVFLGENTNATRQKISSGEYKLINLN